MIYAIPDLGKHWLPTRSPPGACAACAPASPLLQSEICESVSGVPRERPTAGDSVSAGPSVAIGGLGWVRAGLGGTVFRPGVASLRDLDRMFEPIWTQIEGLAQVNVFTQNE